MISRTILYIDDDADDREFLRMSLRQADANVNVVEAENGKAGLSYLEEAKKIGPLPCLIVLDLNMPVLNGRDTFAAISEDDKLKGVPVVVLTTSASPVDKIYFEGKGAAFVSKPTDTEVYRDIAKRMLAYCD